MTKKTSVASSTSYPVLPLRDIVVFPHMIVPLFVVAGVDLCHQHDLLVGTHDLFERTDRLFPSD
ncbi:hypothetical protein ACC760_39490, partial [Rhizobium ruizarguesonis]